MKFGRIFANAIVRRLAYVLVALVLAWVGLGDAHAVCTQTSSNTRTCTTQGEALVGCETAAPSLGAQQCSVTPVRPYERSECFLSDASTYRPRHYCTGDTQPRLNPSTWNQYFKWGVSCSSQPSSTFSHESMIPTGSVGCVNGGPSSRCEFVVTSNGDGTFTRNFNIPGLGTCNVIPNCPSEGWYLNPATSLCTPILQECGANQTKNPSNGDCEDACPSGMVPDQSGVCKPQADDCPAGNVRSPSGQCLPGDGQCAAGEARRPNGTCGVDSDGDGQADEDDEDPENDPDRETASGGDSCSAPPSCSGGPIDCLQAKIQWRIDCNTRHKVNVTGGACGAMPVCVGENCKAMEYAQLLQQWKAACALEKLANADGGGEGGDNADLIALLTGPGSINGEHGDTGGMPGGDGPFQWGEGEEHEPDTTGFGYGSSCPSPPSFTVGGRTISIDLTIMCQWVSLAGSIVLILAGLASVRIVSGGIA